MDYSLDDVKGYILKEYDREEGSLVLTFVNNSKKKNVYLGSDDSTYVKDIKMIENNKILESSFISSVGFLEDHICEHEIKLVQEYRLNNKKDIPKFENISLNDYINMYIVKEKSSLNDKITKSHVIIQNDNTVLIFLERYNGYYHEYITNKKNIKEISVTNFLDNLISMFHTDEIMQEDTKEIYKIKYLYVTSKAFKLIKKRLGNISYSTLRNANAVPKSTFKKRIKNYFKYEEDTTNNCWGYKCTACEKEFWFSSDPEAVKLYCENDEYLITLLSSVKGRKRVLKNPDIRFGYTFF